jgi:hypothetical protein
MIRNLKTLGLAVVAVLAMNVMVVSVASAANEFHSAGTPTTISGLHKSTTALHIPGAGTWECTTTAFHGVQTGTTAKELTIHPTYSGCKAFGFSTTDVSTTGCDYTLTQPSSLKSVTHVVCQTTAGPPHVQHLVRITPTVFGGSVCTVTFGSQSPTGNVSFINNPTFGSGETHVVENGRVLVTSNVTGLKHSAGCGAEAKADATFTGSVLLAGDKGAISVS